MHTQPLSEKHLSELALATERARVQWAKDVTDPLELVAAMDRVVLFLRQNGGAARQARQVSSVAFIVGAQLVKLADWKWMSVSEDGSLNPSVVSPDGRRACLLVDVITFLVAGQTKGSLAGLVKACVEGTAHELVSAL